MSSSLGALLLFFLTYAIFLNQNPRLEQRRRAPNQLRFTGPIVKNLTTIWPILRTTDQMITHWVQANIFPFPCLAFARPKFVIMESFLPPPFASDAVEFVVWARCPRTGFHAWFQTRNHCLQCLHPLPKPRCLVSHVCNYVDMVRHDHESRPNQRYLFGLSSKKAVSLLKTPSLSRTLARPSTQSVSK